MGERLIQLIDTDPFGLSSLDFSIRLPEKSEIFNEEDALTYICGCDYEETSDYKILAEEIAHQLGNKGRLHGQILEVCFGPGNLCGELLRKGATKVIGVDACPIMIKHSSKKFWREIVGGQMQFIQAQAQNLPFSNNTFEGVVNFNSFHQFSDQNRALAALEEMARVLKPGGWGFVRDFRRGASKEVIAKRLEHTKPKIVPLLLDSLRASFTSGEFINMLKQIPNIEPSVTKAKDPRRLSRKVHSLINQDLVEHWRDFSISQDVKITKL